MSSQKNILHQLTTNLSFKNVDKTSSSHGPRVLVKASNQLSDQQDDSETFSGNGKRVADESDDNEDESITILSGIKQVSNKKSKKKKAKNLDQINRERINHLRNLNNININGDDVPDPLENFQHLRTQKTWTNLAIPDTLINNLLSYGFNEPTPVQMQSVPAMLNIYIECSRLSEGTGLKVKILNKMANELKNSELYTTKYDILITTPNKLIFLLKDEKISASLKKIEWMVIDEADRLFEDGENGFREQLAAIYKACDNPKIKHALFSATLTNDVQQWFKNYSNNIIEVSIGRKNITAVGIEQELKYVGNEAGKLLAIKNTFKEGFQPPILIFVQSKKRANDLYKELVLEKINVDIISGDRSQPERDNTIRNFRIGKTWVLISTELMSRGIDFKYVNLVINYDFPQTAISYIHRIGRSGRAGKIGKAVTYFTDNDLPYLRSIANIIRQAGCEVPEYMLKLKKPSKKSKRLLASKAPKRKKISKS